MCYLIYGALILTFAVYSDAAHPAIRPVRRQRRRPVDPGRARAGSWSWALWPVLVLVAMVASALTWFAARLK